MCSRIVHGEESVFFITGHSYNKRLNDFNMKTTHGPSGGYLIIVVAVLSSHVAGTACRQ